MKKIILVIIIMFNVLSVYTQTNDSIFYKDGSFERVYKIIEINDGKTLYYNQDEFKVNSIDMNIIKRYSINGKNFINKIDKVEKVNHFQKVEIDKQIEIVDINKQYQLQQQDKLRALKFSGFSLAVSGTAALLYLTTINSDNNYVGSKPLYYIFIGAGCLSIFSICLTI